MVCRTNRFAWGYGWHWPVQTESVCRTINVVLELVWPWPGHRKRYVEQIELRGDTRGTGPSTQKVYILRLMSYWNIADIGLGIQKGYVE